MQKSILNSKVVKCKWLCFDIPSRGDVVVVMWSWLCGRGDVVVGVQWWWPQLVIRENHRMSPEELTGGKKSGNVITG